jgi:hypothetical protein
MLPARLFLAEMHVGYGIRRPRHTVAACALGVSMQIVGAWSGHTDPNKPITCTLGHQAVWRRIEKAGSARASVA